MGDNTGAGEPQIAELATAFADTRRVRVLMALADGRALPAGRLAEEAGVSASTISNHLRTLLQHRLVSVEQHGRHRYYRLATSGVEAVLEALAGLAPTAPITSLRQHTKAHALRTGRTCYRHLAGQLGVRLFQDMINARWITGGDGQYPVGKTKDRLSAPGDAVTYTLTPVGAAALTDRGLPRAALSTTRPLKYCIDWTEQAHHLAGPLGTAITTHLFEIGLIARGTIPRTIEIPPNGRQRVADWIHSAQPIPSTTS